MRFLRPPRLPRRLFDLNDAVYADAGVVISQREYVERIPPGPMHVDRDDIETIDIIARAGIDPWPVWPIWAKRSAILRDPRWPAWREEVLALANYGAIRVSISCPWPGWEAEFTFDLQLFRYAPLVDIPLQPMGQLYPPRAPQKQEEHRARRLLFAALTPAQRATVRRRGFFDMVVRGRRFRISTCFWFHNVQELLESGDPLREYCAAVKGCPSEDNALAQKLLLETDPGAFFTVANVFSLPDRSLMNGSGNVFDPWTTDHAAPGPLQ